MYYRKVVEMHLIMQEAPMFLRLKKTSRLSGTTRYLESMNCQRSL